MKKLNKGPNRFVVWRTPRIENAMSLESVRQEATDAFNRNPSRQRVYILEVIEVVEPTTPQVKITPFPG